MRITRRPDRPRGPLRWLLRLPVRLFHAGLGRLFGQRLVLLEHVGRRSGARYEVVVEVVARGSSTGTVIVAAGFGPGTDWYRNLLHRPETTIQVGARRRAVTARPLSPTDGATVMVDYARRHPRTARRLVRLMGFADVDDAAGYAAVGAQVPFLALDPRV